MLAKCANPVCGEHFRYLREGRIFNLEIDPPAPGSSPGPQHRIEHFWLCEQCARSLTVVYDQGLVITKSRHLELSQGEPEEPEPKAKLASSGI